MQSIFQHILIGFGKAGESVLRNTSRILSHHGLSLSDRLAMKVLINPAPEGGITAEPLTGKPEAPVEEHPPAGQDPSIPSDRRGYSGMFCKSFQLLDDALKSEWNRVSNPELSRDLAKADFTIKGKKVFIIADLSQGFSSALVIPVMAALRYILRNESIQDIHWNVIGIIGTGQDPISKLNTYSFLREAAYLKQSDEEVTINLKVPPFEREAPLWDNEPMLYLLNAGAWGVSPITLERISQVAARYVFLETFYEPPSYHPSDRELYFHSFGLSESHFPLEETLKSAARWEADSVAGSFKEQENLDKDVLAGYYDEALKRRRIDVDHVLSLLPDTDDFEWQSERVTMADYESPHEMVAGPEKHFARIKERRERDTQKEFSADPAQHNFFKEVSDSVDKLVNGDFFGAGAALDFLNRLAESVKKRREKAGKIERRHPSIQELNRLNLEMQQALGESAPFPVILMGFIFVLMPLAAFLYQFFTWKYPSGDVSTYRIGIGIFVVIASFAGAWFQKYLMEGNTREKFDRYVGYVERYHRAGYVDTLVHAAENFYFNTLHLLTGVEEKPDKRLAEAVKKQEPLSYQVQRYRDMIKGGEYAPEIKRDRFFAVSLLVDPSRKEELADFIDSFLPEGFGAEDSARWQHHVHVFEDVKAMLPGWKSILDGSVEAKEFYKKFYENVLVFLKNKVNKDQVGISEVAGKMGRDKFQPVFENLVKYSQPMVQVSENRLMNEACSGMDEKLILAGLRSLKLDFVTEMAARRRFLTRETPYFSNSVFILQTRRFIQIYKLKDLDDWKYYEERLDDDARKRLYLDDRMISGAHINYEARVTREEGGQ